MNHKNLKPNGRRAGPALKAEVAAAAAAYDTDGRGAGDAGGAGPGPAPAAGPAFVRRFVGDRRGPLKGDMASHHSKFLLVFYPGRGMRVVITSANFIEFDGGSSTNSIFYQVSRRHFVTPHFSRGGILSRTSYC